MVQGMYRLTQASTVENAEFSLFYFDCGFLNFADLLNDWVCGKLLAEFANIVVFYMSNHSHDAVNIDSMMLTKTFISIIESISECTELHQKIAECLWH